jgi:hypothetical protein
MFTECSSGLWEDNVASFQMTVRLSNLNMEIPMKERLVGLAVLMGMMLCLSACAQSHWAVVQTESIFKQPILLETRTGETWYLDWNETDGYRWTKLLMKRSVTPAAPVK